MYGKSIRKQRPGSTVICNNASLEYTTMIDPATGWFEIVEIPTFDLGEVALGNDKFIDKSSARFIQIFNNTCPCRYPHPRKVMFGNGSDFKQDFTHLLEKFNINQS